MARACFPSSSTRLYYSEVDRHRTPLLGHLAQLRVSLSLCRHSRINISAQGLMQ